jgi:hypothetical protein
VPTPFGVEIGPVCRDLDVVLSDLGADGAEPLPHRPQVIRDGTEELLDLLRVRPGGRIHVPAYAPRERVAHEAADEIQLVPRLLEPLPEAPERLGDLDAFSFDHHM